MIHAVILAGGSGTRFWPESRRSLPKQFLKVTGDETLLQATVARCRPWIPAANTWIVTSHLYAAETQRQIPDLRPDQMLLEPIGRNTAPCIGLAASLIREQDPEAIIVVMPADHVIHPAEVFRQTAQQAVQYVEQHPRALVLFGIPPSYPATGFGYIQSAPETGPEGLARVLSFREKPKREVAEAYLAAGHYAWNSGIFVWRADTILAELQQHVPAISELLAQLAPSGNRANWQHAVDARFGEMPSISIDYAVLERSSDVSVLAAPFAWDDVGSWDAVARLSEKDADGNVTQGPVCALETRNCVLRSTDSHLLATYGMEECLVIHTPTATLIARRNDENAMRALVAELEQRGLTQYL